MKFSTGFFDSLFGEKIELELPNGSKRIVTKAWIQKMEREGKMMNISHSMIRVNILGKPKPIDSIEDFQKMLDGENVLKHFWVEDWKIGGKISEKDAIENRDKDTKELYVVMTPREGYSEDQPSMITREYWLKLKSQLDSLDSMW